MQIEKIINKIQQDPEFKSVDKVVICLNKECPSMLEDAFLLSAEGELQRIIAESCINDDQADEAVIRSSESGDDLVTFHETRTSSYNYRPNGIRVHDEDIHFPCVVFWNSGKERLTVEGEWVSPGDYTAIQQMDINSPEAQEALKAHLNSPEVQEGIREAQEMFEEKERALARERAKKAAEQDGR
ncbi:MAG: hypothetical protein HDT33_01610 [Clostridiales bacterium]|nr:hypothetical protein [Clostridiales bacterium]